MQNEQKQIQQKPIYLVNNTKFCKFMHKKNSNITKMAKRILINNLRNEVGALHENINKIQELPRKIEDFNKHPLETTTISFYVPKKRIEETHSNKTSFNNRTKKTLPLQKNTNEILLNSKKERKKLEDAKNKQRNNTLTSNRNLTLTSNKTTNLIMNSLNKVIATAEKMVNKEIEVIEVCSKCIELEGLLRRLTKEILFIKKDIRKTFSSKSLNQQAFLFKFSYWVMKINFLRADIFKLNDLLESLKTSNCPGQEDNTKKLLLLSNASDHLVGIIQNISKKEELNLNVVALS